MIKIKPVPVGYPSVEANAITITILPFNTNALNCNSYYVLFNISTEKDEEGDDIEVVKQLTDGNSFIDDEQFADWGTNNTYIENVVLSNLDLERAIPIE